MQDIDKEAIVAGGATELTEFIGDSEGMEMELDGVLRAWHRSLRGYFVRFHCSFSTEGFEVGR